MAACQRGLLDRLVLVISLLFQSGKDPDVFTQRLHDFSTCVGTMLVIFIGG